MPSTKETTLPANAEIPNNLFTAGMDINVPGHVEKILNLAQFFGVDGLMDKTESASFAENLYEYSQTGATGFRMSPLLVDKMLNGWNHEYANQVQMGVIGVFWWDTLNGLSPVVGYASMIQELADGDKEKERREIKALMEGNLGKTVKTQYRQWWKLHEYVMVHHPEFQMFVFGAIKDLRIKSRELGLGLEVMDRQGVDWGDEDEPVDWGAVVQELSVENQALLVSLTYSGEHFIAIQTSIRDILKNSTGQEMTCAEIMSKALPHQS